MKKYFFTVLTIALSAILFSCTNEAAKTGTVAPAFSLDSAKAAIATSNISYGNSFATADSVSFINHYTSDGCISPSNMPKMCGAQAINAFFNGGYKMGIRGIKLTTDEVMGSLPENEAAFFTESSPFAPNSPYAASKAAAEHLVRAARHTFGLDTVVTRCGNNYGPRQFPEKFLPLAISNALDDEPIPLYGDGRNVRDWIYVDDHCRAILLALEQGKSGAVYNVGARNELRNIDVVQSLLDILDKPHSLIRFVKDRPGHDRRYAIDPALIESELGWRPRETWETGLQKTILWYRDNARWLERTRSGAYQDYYREQYGTEVNAS